MSFDAVLRVSRTGFDVDAFLARHPRIEPSLVWREGEVGVRRRVPAESSGFNLPLCESETPDELARDVEAALSDVDSVLAELRAAGVACLVDVGLIVEPTALFPSYMFSSALLEALSRRGLALEVTFYPGSEDDEPEDGAPVH